MDHDAEFDESPHDAGSPGPSSDGEGLAAQWERARTAVFALLLAKIGSLHDAEDVLQEVAVCVARDYHKYDPERPFVAWALGIARNQALMYFRKKSRDRLAFGDDMIHLIQAHLEQNPAPASEYQREALHACVQALSPDRRSLLRMRYGSDSDLADIAEKQGKSVASVKGQLYRIRKILLLCVKRRLATP
ncbi:sigma-70 family RNA polymerase sigma factor [Aeoliella mucimassa]|uniref:RNA polymerase sigma factor SigM n=1 Tax=Aeoliella mucimassa TaxID=2527972 RepID=A0A518APD8_9BACT|nr:sigma-70 family RNA polymerase sigma factor [Aeoliella mucimassa]QDU56585.1 RNA polymerase sigma factor SigM [Aeoliella mucimassa]